MATRQLLLRRASCPAAVRLCCRRAPHTHLHTTLPPPHQHAQDYADFALIVALLLVNATISYVEEANADKAIKALTSGTCCMRCALPRRRAGNGRRRNGRWTCSNRQGCLDACLARNYPVLRTLMFHGPSGWKPLRLTPR